jgi:hypothetical protein
MGILYIRENENGKGKKENYVIPPWRDPVETCKD